MDEKLKELLSVCREHYARREFDRAEPILRRILEITDRFADVYHMLAMILHDKGDVPGAERLLERAIEINPVYTEALLNLSVVYNELGKYEAARRIFERIQGNQNGDGLPDFVRGKLANMHADLAHAYVEAGCKREAIVELEKAIGLCPGFSDLRTRLGNLYRETGELALACENFVAALASNPRYIPACLMLGLALHAMGDERQATAEWRAVLLLDANNENAKTYLRMVDDQREARASTLPPLPPEEVSGRLDLDVAMCSDESDRGPVIS